MMSNNKSLDEPSFRSLDDWCYFIPVVAIALIWLSYWWAPEFYFTYVLEEHRREFQIVELLTGAAGICGGSLMLLATWELWVKNWRVAAAIVGVMAAATLFFAGEESSWGQSYWGWSTPEWWDSNVAYETNLHNSRISVWAFHNLAGLFQVVMFGLLPVAWMLREQLRLPDEVGPAIPELPVVMCIFVAFVYRETKNIWRAWYPTDEIFQEFLWGMNEHREMLVALGLLFYGIYKWKKARVLPDLKDTPLTYT